VYTAASRRVLPFIGTTSNHFQAGPSGPTGSAAVGDYFINTNQRNLYSYGSTGWRHHALGKGSQAAHASE
jgi:hypothetical protein